MKDRTNAIKLVNDKNIEHCVCIDVEESKPECMDYNYKVYYIAIAEKDKKKLRKCNDDGKTINYNNFHELNVDGVCQRYLNREEIKNFKQLRQKGHYEKTLQEDYGRVYNVMGKDFKKYLNKII
ncbi:hypothetical protein [uncultured Mediterranean phage uvMED]|nr:hypothetical protein [uncultured Mediterranean phage uvMED]